MKASLRVACVAVLVPAAAQAADPCDVSVNNACIDSDTFWPHAGAQRFANTGGTEPLPRGEVSFGLISSYSSRPVTLVTASPGRSGSRAYAVDHQLTEHFVFGLGLTERLHAAFVLPATLVQDGEGLRPVTGGAALRSQAMRDLRFGIGLSLIDRRTPPLAAEAGQAPPGPRHTDLHTLLARRRLSYGLMARFEVAAPTGDRDAFATNATAVFVPSLAGDVRYGRLLIGAELSARVREVRESFGQRQGTQLGQSIGVAYDLFDNELLSPYAEFRALFGVVQNRESVLRADGSLSSQTVRGGQAPGEWLVGLRSAPLLGGDLAFDLSGGGGVPLTGDDFGVPRYRFTLGLRFAPQGRDSDGDGVPDRADACPHQRQVIPAGSEAPHDGCVHEPEAPLDLQDLDERPRNPVPSPVPSGLPGGAPPSSQPPAR